MPQKIDNKSQLAWKMKTFPVIFLIAAYGCGGGGGGGSPGSESEAEDEISEVSGEGIATAVDDGVVDPTGGRVWTVAEILLEPPNGGKGGPALCGGEFGFKRCVCAESVPPYVRYRPAVAECNGNAAAILSDRLLDAFSVVVRDTQNRDRWPLPGSGFGGCTEKEASSKNPPNYCSAFKVQSKFLVGFDSAMVHCFGASGYSDIFSDAVRLTVKLNDDPFSNDDDIERYCLAGPTLPLN